MGGNGAEWDASHGAGGGGGGGGVYASEFGGAGSSGDGGAGGLYGGGGGGGGRHGGPAPFYALGGLGGQGIIVITPTDGSSRAISTTLATVSSGVQSATLTATGDAGTGTISYYLSNDDGATWESVTSGSPHTFSNRAGTKLKYRIDLTGDATVSSLQIAYNNQNVSGTLSNYVLDAGGDASMVSLGWTASFDGGATVKFRTRGAATQGALSSATWSDYLEATSTGASDATILANGNGGAPNPQYRFLEVEATLVSLDGASVPTLTGLSVSYAINAPPQFDTTLGEGTGASVSQVSDPQSANWGKVWINYAAADPDDTTLTPSFEYRLNNTDSWHPMTTLTGDTSAFQVGPPPPSGLFTLENIYWDAKKDLPDTFSASAQVRVSLNDGEIIYNKAYATSSPFTLETKVPTVTAHIDGTSPTNTFAANVGSDANLLDYTLTNNPTGGPDGVNEGSGVPTTITTSKTLSLSQPWILPAATTTSTTYLSVRDIYGNTSTSTIVVPAAPQGFEIHDISNTAANLYKLFVAWQPYVSATGATFTSGNGHYEVWRSAGDTYTKVATITDPSLNYYMDTDVASTTTYSYQIVTVSAEGNSSPFTTPQSTQPLGLGGSSLPPVIQNVVADQIKNTSARITWETNGLSNSLVNYGIGTSYGSTASSQSYTTDHTVYLTHLQPNTPYYFKVTSSDFYTNAATDDQGGASYTFTTNGGPVIENVTVNSVADTAANIFWNTDRSADSQVYYSTQANLSDALHAGDDTPVASSTTEGIYSHQVALTGLTPTQTYYFYVTSSDADQNLTRADNQGQYYSFLTTKDTTPPKISNIRTPVINASTAVIVWQTDKRSTSQVEWGDTASTSEGAYPHTTLIDATGAAASSADLLTDHVVTLSNLASTSDYYYRVRSSDAAGNLAYSDEQHFKTTSGDTITTEYVSTGFGSSAKANTTPPTISNTTVEPINTFDATVKVGTDADVRALVQYGPVSSTTPSAPYTLSAGDWNLSNTKSIQLSNLLPSTTYHYIVNVSDKNGLTTKSKDQTFTTKFLSEDLGNLSSLQAADIQSRLEDAIQSALPSINPPFSTVPTITNISESSSTIAWNTNVKSYASLTYASDEDYQKKGIYTDTLAENDIAATTTQAHTIILTNLKSDTKYHFSTRALVFPQVVGKSADYTFTTKAGPLTPSILDVKTDSFRVLWATDANTTSAIDFRDTTTGVTQTLKNETPSKQHDLIAQNLISGHTYLVRAYGYDTDGNLLSTASTIPVTTGVDTTPPQVTGLRIDSNLVPGRTDIVQSIVSWKTDKASNSAVYYEEGSGTADQALKNKVENDTGLVTDHVVILPSLKPSTIYRVQVSSTDQAGNTLMLPVRTIVTPQQSESIIDIIFKNFSSTFNFTGQ